jgi:putative ABC transport system substrate-binding protein
VNAASASRRTFLLCAALLATGAARAQAAPPKRVVMVVDWIATPNLRQARTRWFAAEGLVERRDVVVEYAELPKIRAPAEMETRARAIVSSRPDVIVIDASEHIALFRRLTSDIPLVFVNLPMDPVRVGMVENLRRPGGNLTGTMNQDTELFAKAWEMAKELRPTLRRVGFLVDDGVPAAFLDLAREDAAAIGARLQIEFVQIIVPRGAAFADAERAIRAAKVDGLTDGFSEDPTWLPDLIRFLVRANIVPVVGDADAVRLGSLLAVQTNTQRGARDAVTIAAKILRGARPGDIPVHVNRDVIVSINLGTARAMGIKVPESMRVRANLVIE